MTLQEKIRQSQERYLQENPEASLDPVHAYEEAEQNNPKAPKKVSITERVISGIVIFGILTTMYIYPRNAESRPEPEIVTVEQLKEEKVHFGAAHFAEIRMDMSFDDVVEILGRPSSHDSSFYASGTYLRTYTWGSWLWGSVSISFDNDKVYNKNQFGLSSGIPFEPRGIPDTGENKNLEADLKKFYADLVHSKITWHGYYKNREVPAIKELMLTDRRVYRSYGYLCYVGTIATPSNLLEPTKYRAKYRNGKLAEIRIGTSYQTY